MSEMEGKVALVTGATSGIGRATALRFAAEGAQVALVARRAADLAGVVQAIGAKGGQAQAIAADITDEAEIERVVRETVGSLGGIDVLVNAAGILTGGSIETTRLQDWDYMMNLNARAPFYLIQCALPYLIERRGAIVNVSSVTGITFPGILAYCASKAASTSSPIASLGWRARGAGQCRQSAWSSPICTAPAAAEKRIVNS